MLPCPWAAAMGVELRDQHKEERMCGLGCFSEQGSDPLCVLLTQKMPAHRTIVPQAVLTNQLPR